MECRRHADALRGRPMHLCAWAAALGAVGLGAPTPTPGSPHPGVPPPPPAHFTRLNPPSQPLRASPSLVRPHCMHRSDWLVGWLVRPAVVLSSRGNRRPPNHASHVLLFPLLLLAAARRRRQVSFTDEEWKRRLTPGQYAVLRKEVTERRFSRCMWELVHVRPRANVCVCGGGGGRMAMLAR